MFFSSKKNRSKASKKRAHVPLISDQNSDPFLVEAFRSLLSNIRYCGPGRPLKSILITSSGAQEGKSTIVANLGILLAQEGSRVLLVDADMRAPTLSKIFKLNTYPGLSDLLMQISNTKIAKGSIENFSVGDALQLLHVQRKSGILTIEKDEKAVSLYIQDGEFIEAPVNNLHKSQDLRDLLRIKEGTFQFEENPLFNEDIDMSDDLPARRNLNKILPQIYRKPFIESRMNEFIKNTAIQNLKLLTSGRLPPNPPQLLGSEGMRVMVTMFSNSFDAVIIDTPPAGILSDAYALAPLVDGLILVVRQGFYDKNLIQMTKKKLERITPNLCGAIFNQATSKNDSYYYAYHGYSDIK
jgi:Mrp family chromosome partitioning ATPase